MSILIKDTTREERERIVSESLGAMDASCDGCSAGMYEMYQDYMHRIQARSPFLQTFVVQLASYEGGTYLPTERGVKNKGYSASIACNLVGFEGGQDLVEGTLRMLNELNEQ